MKSTFKTFLTENKIADAIENFDATKIDTTTLWQGQGNEPRGYTASVYSGYDEKTKSHLYHMIWEDEDAEDEDRPFAIQKLFVFLNKEGHIEMDSSGHPEADGLTKDEAVKKLATLKK